MVNRAAGRSGKNVKIDNTVSVAKQQITITENVKNTEKEKKQVNEMFSFSNLRKVKLML